MPLTSFMSGILGLPSFKTRRRGRTMIVALGADHAGVPHKDILVAHLIDKGVTPVDMGSESATESVDYPDFAQAVSELVASGEADFGILVCGTGIGMAIAANKVKGIRAANVTDPEFAVLTRAHNNANVLALSGRFTDIEVNKQIVDAFLETAYEGGRHQGRIDKMMSLEN